jgi:hypothetical protein
MVPNDLLGYRLWIASHRHPLVCPVRRQPEPLG